MPSVTVIIPTFNRGPLVEEAINSVLNQSFQDTEIIVVDDGSTDDTEARISRYGSRVQFIRQANSGASVARNNGILAARGELIAFLDSDDLFLPNHLEQSVALLREEKGVDFVFGDIEKFDRTGVIMASFFQGKLIETIPFETRGKNRRIFTRSIFPELIAGNFIPTPTLVLRRECFARIGIFDSRFRFLNDAEMYLRLAKAYRGAYFSEVVARVRVGDDNLTNKKWNVARAKLKLQLLRDLADASGGLHAEARSIWRKQCETVHFNLAYDLLCAGQAGEARSHALSSLRKNAFQPKAMKIIAMTFLPPPLVAKARLVAGNTP